MSDTVFHIKKDKPRSGTKTMDPELQKEQQEEEELLKASKEQKEEQVRAKVIEQYGLNENDNAVLIEQLVTDRLADMKSFGKVIEQKRNWREKATKAVEPAKPVQNASTLTSEQIAKQAREEARAELEARDLEELTLPDELKSEVQRIAKIQNVSIRKAAQDPYILSKKEAYEKQQKQDEATLSRKNNRGAATTAFSVDKPPQPDMSTPEGQKEWAEYKAWLSKQKI
jgi:hypothetical protein